MQPAADYCQNAESFLPFLFSVEPAATVGDCKSVGRQRTEPERCVIITPISWHETGQAVVSNRCLFTQQQTQNVSFHTQNYESLFLPKG